mmetsp:Transcript_39535/g.95600  ORF Transcript_39535/g.95600 Transcript_39535/m.95600 type:complete len:229 (+) Transcript_39535:105-791(+)
MHCIYYPYHQYHQYNSHYEVFAEEREQAPITSYEPYCWREGATSPHLIEDSDSEKPRVRFAPVDKEESMAQSPPPRIEKLTREICYAQWFQAKELSIIRKTARADAANVSPKVDKSGLERYTWERISEKKKAVQEVVKAQKVSKDPHYLKNVLRKRSVQSRRLAAYEGQKMSHEAYGFPSYSAYEMEPTRSVSLKRKPWDCPRNNYEDQGRRVRQRTIMPTVPTTQSW